MPTHVSFYESSKNYRTKFLHEIEQSSIMDSRLDEMVFNRKGEGTMSNAITEAQTIDQVVDIINASNTGNASEYFGGTDTRDAEEMAGQYAWEAAEESGYTDDRDIEAQLDYLAEAGAEFDFSAALKNAINRKKQ